MDLSLTLFVLLELVVGATATVVAFVAWTYRDRPGGTPLLAMAVTGVAYAATSVVESTVGDPMLWELVTGLQYPLTAALAVESFYLAAEFTRRERYLRPAVTGPLVGVVVVILAVSLTDPAHDLLRGPPELTAMGVFTATYGPLFWMHTLVSLAIILASVTLLTVELANADGIYREQITAVVVGFLLGIAFFLWESLAPIHPAFNLATVGIVGWCFATLWGVFRVDLLETRQVARKTLIDGMADPVIALDTEDRVLDTNPRARDLLDLDDDDVGTPVTAALSAYPPLLDAIDAGEDEREITLRRDGGERHYRIKQSPVYHTRSHAGRLGDREVRLGRTVVIEDVTERRNRERELERQNEHLDEFVSVVSHDLRNPLNVAAGHAELARQECDSDHLDEVLRSHERMETLIEDLLTLARSGRSIDETEAVDLPAVARRCWRNVETDGATLSVETDQTVVADRTRLQQLLENLVRNSVEHGSTDSRPEADDSVEHGAGNDDGVTVTVGAVEDGFFVADDGSGIDAAEHERVFESGYSTGDEGSGLGLHIVERIAEAHGWSVRAAESAAGGARFEIIGVEAA
jgi:signal transduction histidine kinase